MKDVEQALRSVTPEWRAFVLHYLARYIGNEAKMLRLGRLPPQATTSLAAGILLMTAAGDWEVDEARADRRFPDLLAIARESQEARKVLPRLSLEWERSRQRLILRLRRARRKLEDQIIGAELVNVRRLSSRDRRAGRTLRLKLLRNLRSRVDVAPLFAKHQVFCEAEEDARSPLLGGFMLDDVFLFNSGDPAERLACVLINPLGAVARHLELMEAWSDFPLKWFVKKVPCPDARWMLREFARGNDLNDILVERYRRGARRFLCSDEVKASFFAQRRLPQLEETAEAFDRALYNAAICTALPAIEGILWDFAHCVHNLEGGVFDAQGAAIHQTTGVHEKKPRIGTVVSRTKLSTILDSHFIEEFCEELYPERNDILHGRHRSFACERAAVQKMLVLEYLVDVSEEHVSQILSKRFKAIVNPRLVERYVGGEQPGADDLVMVNLPLDGN